MDTIKLIRDREKVWTMERLETMRKFGKTSYGLEFETEDFDRQLKLISNGTPEKVDCNERRIIYKVISNNGSHIGDVVFYQLGEEEEIWELDLMVFLKFQEKGFSRLIFKNALAIAKNLHLGTLEVTIRTENILKEVISKLVKEFSFVRVDYDMNVEVYRLQSV